MRVWSYVYISITMMLIFILTGTTTESENVFNYFGVLFDSSGISLVQMTISGIFSYLFSVTGFITILVGGGISLGLYLVGKADIALKAGFASVVLQQFLALIIFPLTRVIGSEASWVVNTLAVIFIPFTIGFIMSLVYFIVGGTSD